VGRTGTVHALVQTNSKGAKKREGSKEPA